MYKCPIDNHDLKLTGEEDVKAWFMCPKCNRWYVVDLRDDSIELYKEQYKTIKGLNVDEERAKFMNCISIQAGEDIRNNTICVYLKEVGIIRNMAWSEDLKEQLVYVSNIQPINEEYENFIIKTGSMCRCVFVNVSEKFMGV